MWFFGKKEKSIVQETEKPKEMSWSEAAYRELNDLSDDRYAALTMEIDSIGRIGGPKYAVRVLIRLVLRLEDRVKELEKRVPNAELRGRPLADGPA